MSYAASMHLTSHCKLKVWFKFLYINNDRIEITLASYQYESNARMQI